jgi:prevent-host-death family protein
MKEIGVSQARQQFSRLLNRVEAGEGVVITRRGNAVARLVPAGVNFDRARSRMAAQAIRMMRKGVSLDGLSIRALVNEGRAKPISTAPPGDRS